MGSLDSFPVLRIHPQNKGVMAARQSPDKDLYLITVVGCYMILCGSSVCNGDQGAPASVKHQVIPIAIDHQMRRLGSSPTYRNALVAKETGPPLRIWLE